MQGKFEGVLANVVQGFWGDGAELRDVFDCRAMEEGVETEADGVDDGGHRDSGEESR